MDKSPLKMDNKTVFRIKPLIVKKGSIFLNPKLKSDKPFTHEGLYKEDLLYDTTDMYFLKGEYQRLLLVNRYNIVTKQSRAIAKYYSEDGTVTEKSSDRVTEVIGQDQYKTIFTALCSILDQELKIRSILALLTADKKTTELLVINNKEDKKPIKILMENFCQTDEMRIEKLKPKRRNRKPVSPYIVQDVDAVVREARKRQLTLSDKIEEKKELGTKKTKRVIINVRKVNHIDPNTLEGVILKSEVTSILPCEDDHDQEQENDGNNSDPLSAVQSDLPSLTHLNIQAKNFHDLKTEISNLTDLGNQASSLTDLDNQTSYLTDLDKQDATTDLGRKRSSVDGLPELGQLTDLHNDGSNDSAGLSVLSDTSTNPELLRNPKYFLNNIDQHTREFMPQAQFKIPGTDIVVPYKPEDIFHIATKENLQYLNMTDKKKLLQHQLTIDSENCLTVMDEDGNLPIHLAVLNNDAELLLRQCVVLKMRGSSLDIPDDGMTPLKLAIATGNGALAAALVRHGACPLRTDGDHRASAHDAAEKDADVLRAVLTACKENARKILYENEDLWKAEMETQSDEELAQYLLKYICSMFNRQGYNPLMLASMLGFYENVRVLIEHSANVNDRMPTCGNTALYLASAAACNSSIEIGNKSKVVDHFRQTIELLVQNGADPCIENNYGTNVHTLLQEFNNYELSMLVANKQYLQLLNKKDPRERDAAKVMLVLGGDGDIQCKNLENERNTRKKRDKKPTDNELLIVQSKKNTNKPVIVENVVLKPGNTASDAKKVDKTKSKNINVVLCSSLPKMGSNGKVAIPILKNNHAVKRVKSVEPKVIKQTKLKK